MDLTLEEDLCSYGTPDPGIHSSSFLDILFDVSVDVGLNYSLYTVTIVFTVFIFISSS